MWNIAQIDSEHEREWKRLVTSQGEGLIIRSIRTDYKFVIFCKPIHPNATHHEADEYPKPMTWPDRISVYHKLRSAPAENSDSFILEAIILSEVHQRIAARCVEDNVVYDYTQGRKTAMRPFMRDFFRDVFRRQEEARDIHLHRIKDLLGRVELLEKETWDHENAKEDFGSAGP